MVVRLHLMIVAESGFWLGRDAASNILFNVFSRIHMDLRTKWLQGCRPISELHLDWLRGYDLQALRVPMGVAAQTARAVLSERDGRPMP